MRERYHFQRMPQGARILYSNNCGYRFVQTVDHAFYTLLFYNRIQAGFQHKACQLFQWDHGRCCYVISKFPFLVIKSFFPIRGASTGKAVNIKGSPYPKVTDQIRAALTYS